MAFKFFVVWLLFVTSSLNIVYSNRDDFIAGISYSDECIHVKE